MISRDFKSNTSDKSQKEFAFGRLKVLDMELNVKKKRDTPDIDKGFRPGYQVKIAK